MRECNAETWVCMNGGVVKHAGMDSRIGDMQAYNMHAIMLECTNMQECNEIGGSRDMQAWNGFQDWKHASMKTAATCTQDMHACLCPPHAGMGGA